MSTFLGQIIPAVNNQCFSKDVIKEIVTKTEGSEYSVYVGSTNAMKKEAAQKAVSSWLGKTVSTSMKEILLQGFDAQSKIFEQPNGQENTKLGAENRLTHLKDGKTDPNELRFYVTMENGLIKEKVPDVKNPDTFVDPTDKMVWVDRCYVIVEVAYKSFRWQASAFSDGVTTPLACAEKAKESGWNKTAGSFIEAQYGFNAKDWHGQLAGKSRSDIMQQAVTNALGEG